MTARSRPRTLRESGAGGWGSASGAGRRADPAQCAAGVSVSRVGAFPFGALVPRPRRMVGGGGGATTHRSGDRGTLRGYRASKTPLQGEVNSSEPPPPWVWGARAWVCVLDDVAGLRRLGRASSASSGLLCMTCTLATLGAGARGEGKAQEIGTGGPCIVQLHGWVCGLRIGTSRAGSRCLAQLPARVWYYALWWRQVGVSGKACTWCRTRL